MITKEELGHDTWVLLHSLAAGLDDPPTPEQQIRIMGLIYDIGQLYPCEECRPGFSYADQHQPDFSSRAAFEVWMCGWHDDVNAHTGKELIKCEPEKIHSTYEMACSTCSRTKIMTDPVADIFKAEREGPPLTTQEGQHATHAYLDILSAKAAKAGFNVPVPKIKFEESQFCPGTSCTIMDAKHPIETTSVFYHPRTFSMRTTGHEFYHYLSTVLPPEKVKALLCGVGVACDFKGDPDDEREADMYAFKMMDELTSENQVKINRDGGPTTTGMPDQIAVFEQPKVMKQELMVSGDVLSGLSRLYDWAVPYAGVSSSELNQSYTPELLGTAFETLFAVVATPLGALVLNVASWAALSLAARYGQVSGFDKAIFTEWGAHHLLRLLTLANPTELSAVTGGARAAGQAVGAGKAMEALAQVVKQPTEISGGFRSAFAAVQAAFAGFKYPFPASNPAGSADTGHQFGGNTGVVPFQ